MEIRELALAAGLLAIVAAGGCASFDQPRRRVQRAATEMVDLIRVRERPPESASAPSPR
jgi:hypothetical protein